MLRKLARTGLLTPSGVYRLLESLLATGVNLMALLRVAAKLHPERIAVTDEQERISYADLWRQAEALAVALRDDYALAPQQKVAIACRNHAAVIKALFACSRLGAHIYLINPEMSADQLHALHERMQFAFFIHDESLVPVFEDPRFAGKALPAYDPGGACVNQLSRLPLPARGRLRKVKSGNIVVMTGGTTGQPKAASRKPSLADFLPPFVALLTQIHLDRHRTVYVATPVYHGFGLATLFMGVILGKEMCFTRRFDAARACELIAEHKVEVVTLVPLMLQRMLRHDPSALGSLKCIISGGAMLSPALARESISALGSTLFNLYGTSEGGVAIMATPSQLSEKPESIGQPIRGVAARILNPSDVEVRGRDIGRLCIRSTWTTRKKNWIETGDLAFRDEAGDIFLCGRADDMIVSGGENVYPIELENVLLQHPEVAAAAVVGISDAEFGQRLKAVIVRSAGSTLDKDELLLWLKPRIARYQTPAVVEYRDELPHTPLGKLDKKALRE